MAKARKGKELAVLVPNRIGLLEEISSALAKARINILSISGYILGDDQANLLMMVDKHAAAKKVLNRLSGFRVAEDSVVCLELPNKPGEIAKVAAKIRGAGIDINYLYGTASGRTSVVVMKTRDDAKALKIARK